MKPSTKLAITFVLVAVVIVTVTISHKTDSAVAEDEKLAEVMASHLSAISHNEVSTFLPFLLRIKTLIVCLKTRNTILKTFSIGT